MFCKKVYQLLRGFGKRMFCSGETCPAPILDSGKRAILGLLLKRRAWGDFLPTPSVTYIDTTMSQNTRTAKTTNTDNRTGFWVLFATILASSMAFIDSTALNVALPALQNDLQANASDLLWIVNAYALLLASLLLVGGSLGDHYGRKRMFMVGIVLFAMTTLFSFITLPVEFDASRRGLAWINKSGFLAGRDYGMAKDGLWWAAMTYVVAALSSLATLAYYVMIFMGGRRN